MSDINNPVESCERRRQAVELTEFDLCKIVGGSGKGKVSLHDFSIIKHVDKASPVFFL